jgi:CheY-like chemotaxis protein
MTDPGYSVLLVDADAQVRARLTDQLSPLGCTVLEARDGDSALRVLRENDVRVVLSELYLKTGDDACLIHAVRRAKALRNTRTLAHTRHGKSPDREWAVRAGADAYLIQPTRGARLRYAVASLANQQPTPAKDGKAKRSSVARRNSLDVALNDVERGALKGTSSIVFGREWWGQLTPAQQAGYRKRARKAGVGLRSDSLLGDHFVEVRAPMRAKPRASALPESPYRG